MKKKIKYWSVRIVGVFLLILLILYIALRTDFVQNKLAKVILSSISGNYNAKWHVDHVHLDFFDELSLEGVLFLDQEGDTLLASNHIYVDIGVFSLFGKEVFLDEISMDGLHSNIHLKANDTIYNYSFLIPKSEEKESSKTSSATWKFGIGDINITDINFKYDNNDQNIHVAQDLIKLSIKELALEESRLDIAALKLEKGSIYIKQKSNGSEEESLSILPDLGYNINLGQLNLDQENIIFQNLDQNITANALTGKVKDLTWIKSNLNADIEGLTVDLKDIINIKEGSGEIEIVDQDLIMRNTSISSSADLVKADLLKLTFNPSIQLETKKLDASIGQGLIKKYINLIPEKVVLLKNAFFIAKADHLFYSENEIQSTALQVNYGKAISFKASAAIRKLNTNNPSIDGAIPKVNIDLPLVKSTFPNVDFTSIPNKFNKLTGSISQINGSLNQLDIGRSTIEIDQSQKIDFKGQLSKLNNLDKITYRVDIMDLIADSQHLPIPDLEAINSNSLGVLTYKGEVEGTSKTIKLKGFLESAIGSLKSDIQVDLASDTLPMAYVGAIEFQDFDLGKLLNRTDISTLSLSAAIDLKGSDLNSMQGDLSSSISSITYNGYTVQDGQIVASIDKGKLQSSIQIKDKNISLNYEGLVNISDDRYQVEVYSHIDTLVPSLFGISDQDIGIEGDLKASFNLPLQDEEGGLISIYNLGINSPSTSFKEDSILISFGKYSDTTSINAKSSFLAFESKGVFKIADLGNNLIHTLNDYYPIKSELMGNPSSGFIQGSGKIHNVHILDMLIPEQKINISQGVFNFNADFDKKIVAAELAVDTFAMDGYSVDSLSFTLFQEDDQLVIQTEALRTSIGDKYEIPDLSIKNSIENSTINTHILSGPKQGELADLALTFSTQAINDGITINVSDSLQFGSKLWKVDQDNSIRIENESFVIKDLSIRNLKESLSIASLDNKGESLRVDFSGFDVSSIGDFFYSDSTTVTGKVTGHLNLMDFKTAPCLISDLDIAGISFNGINIGALSANGTTDAASRSVQSKLILSGANTANIDVKYNPENRQTDLQVSIESLNMDLVDLIIPDLIENSKGRLSGRLDAKGPIDRLAIDGVISLDSVTTSILANNSRYTFRKHEVSFDQSKIDIGDMTLKDIQGNSAILSGEINHDYFENMNLDISLNTDKFQFLNTSNKINPIVYGKVVLAAQVKITGPPDLLQVDVVAKTIEDTNITLSPFSETETLLKESFLSYGKPEDNIENSAEYLLKLGRQFPFDINLLLETTDKATMNFVIDPLTGDKIVGQGNGDLRVKLTPDGKQEIYGVYNVSSGSYSFSYGDFVSKQFAISPGSTVKFNGNPLTAQLDIDAIYKVYTSTYELIKNEVTISESEIETAKRRREIDVYLSLDGSLLEPKISLDIRAPNSESAAILAGVELKLQELRNNPNELNNQVFGLLIFNSFLLSSSGNTSLNSVGEGIALNSLSSLISNQLNKLANNAIKGVDLNFDLNSYNSQYTNDGAGGNVTEIGLSASKQLFNDRLKLTAGGNINLEDQGGTSQYSSLVGDFVLEYQLTEKGTYRVRVFSKSNYDRLLNENSNKNGVSLYFNKAFDSKTEAKN